MTPTEIWIRLMAVNGLYGDTMVQLAKRLIAAGTIDGDFLRSQGLSAGHIRHFLSFPSRALDETCAWLSLPGHRLLTAGHPDYPPALRATVDYPGALFVAGHVGLMASEQIAIVGSRKHSWYGERWGRIFSEAIARRGITVTSGMALGIDGVAHRAALDACGRTIAVLGNGLLHTYPRRHASLAKRIVESGGVLVSEFPLALPPFPANFPRRNRIISGLSRGVLVVEAALKSGSLVTARAALEQGRDVFAVPGPLGNPGSEGPHWLIKQGAIPVTTIEDILENLQYGRYPPPDEPEKSNFSPDTEFAALPFPELLANVGDEVTPVDVVAERAGQPVPVTVAQLLELELAGWIAAVPGGYVRLRRACHVRRTDVFV
ncbi:DNA-protecting protein DprA [Enterobacter sp. CC120223-11]|uniref:DNA-protecting protein DprA n=1 Tax=Enterobacter sp. CC120223-11 TaxID=1378073 RepID=UPI000BD51955|nr:DNA-protecting protein DprA [Enterobacter sp. CC120223-11]SNY80255.1 DNA processing protein [Enterobacter sp. CC120223-11]